MSLYGIGSGMTTALETFVQASRRTGRTTQMLDTVCNMPKGAPVAILTAVHQEGRRLMYMLHERGRKDIRVFCILHGDPYELSRLRASFEGHIVFDHLFEEAYWRHEIRLANERFIKMHADFSRTPEAYRTERF